MRPGDLLERGTKEASVFMLDLEVRSITFHRLIVPTE